jgi:hypothetical protein
MKAMPTLEGGLRLDVEDAGDWELLRSIVTDAQLPAGDDLASQLSGLIDDSAGSEDWTEFVEPDLREAFQDELAQVAAAVESAVVLADGGPGPVRITREDAWPWYSALNQARLALEARFKFGSSDAIDFPFLTPEQAGGFIRSRFYCSVQSLLLEFVME